MTFGAYILVLITPHGVTVLPPFQDNVGRPYGIYQTLEQCEAAGEQTQENAWKRSNRVYYACAPGAVQE